MALSRDDLTGGYQGAVGQVRARVLAFVAAVWSNSSAFRDADVDLIVARIVPVIQSGQMQVAQLTDAYIGKLSMAAGITYFPAPPVRAEVVDYRGVPADSVYRRPAVAVYTALSKGETFSTAVEQGLNRLLSIASTDIQQAQNRQATASMSRSGWQFFRRQLTGNENCALCAIASTQRYTRGDLMPMHPACDCTVLPIESKTDPGQVIDGDLLERVHLEVERFVGVSDRGGRAPQYKDLLITNQHGELGPVLGWRGDNFTGPADLPAVL